MVLKELAPKLLVQCIRKVHGGGEWFETRSIGRLMGKIRQRNGELTRGNGLLTSREIEIMRIVAEGLSNQGIGQRLSIHEGTVKVHVHHIYEKLQVTSRVALLRHAQGKGWV